MRLPSKFVAAGKRWAPLNFYQRFEDAVVFVLTALISIVIALALWNLALKIVLGGVLTSGLDLTNYAVFQTLFGMVFTVIIALEFKKSLLVVAERRDSIVQVRTVVLIALLAALRKLIILEPGKADPIYLFGLSAIILSLGAVFWLVRSQDDQLAKRGPG
jgi:uncharacterized membrane protein (DUF373 family)